MKHIERQLFEDAQAFNNATQGKDLSAQHAEIMSRIQSGDTVESGLEQSHRNLKWPLAAAASIALFAVFIINNINTINSQPKVKSQESVAQIIQKLDSEKLQEKFEGQIENQLMEQMRQEQLAISADVNYLKGLFFLSASR
ncbi:hypothetical protein [Marinicella sp. W31]|uniref:hypothetical protein n=1 Tax=Marinicella sp. W31 TaxID=3023713 RepID=UPI003756FBED